ncbi:MAG: aldose epimerase, partial [Thermoanaerobaculia bacterium]|nr:aldose epimerase [Thermoanaerobaculia bacterium]
MTSLHTLQNDKWQVGILPETGGSIAFGRVQNPNGGDWLDFMRPTPPDAYDNVSLTASFVLVPWSNRIRDGVFTYKDDTYQLHELKDGNATHGITRNCPWSSAVQ